MGIDKTFKALDDKNRREILRLLKKGSMNVGEIAENFSMSSATLSYHITLLKEAGLIFEIKDKNYRNYSLNTSVFEEVLKFIYEFQEERQ